MRVWRFYIIKRKCKMDSAVLWRESSNPVELYAITCVKEYAEEFMRDRDMKQFSVQTSKMTKEEWMRYAAQNRGKVLDLYQVSSNEKDGKVVILMTDTENTTLDNSDSEYIMFNLADIVMRNNCPNPKWFNHHFFQKMDRIGYASVYKCYCSDISKVNPMEDDFTIDMFDGNPMVNQLSLFIKEYGPLFR